MFTVGITTPASRREVFPSLTGVVFCAAIIYATSALLTSAAACASIQFPEVPAFSDADLLVQAGDSAPDVTHLLGASETDLPLPPECPALPESELLDGLVPSGLTPPSSPSPGSGGIVATYFVSTAPFQLANDCLERFQEERCLAFPPDRSSRLFRPPRVPQQRDL